MTHTVELQNPTKLSQLTGLNCCNQLMTNLNIKNSTLSCIGEHLKDTGHDFEESKAAVIAREENNFRRRIREAFEIVCQSWMLNQDRGFELPALYWDVLAHDLVHPTSRDK